MKILLDIQQDSANPEVKAKLEVTPLAQTVFLKISDSEREIRIDKEELKQILALG